MAKEANVESKPKAAKVKADKPGIFARLGQYFRDVRGEMKRVVWPQRPEIVNSSIVVVVTLLFFVAFTFIIDSIAVQILDLLRQIG